MGFTLKVQDKSCSIEITRFPTETQPGEAIFCGADGQVDILTFSFNVEDRYEGSLICSDTKFLMQPILNGDNRIVSLDVHENPSGTDQVLRFDWEEPPYNGSWKSASYECASS